MSVSAAMQAVAAAVAAANHSVFPDEGWVPVTAWTPLPMRAAMQQAWRDPYTPTSPPTPADPSTPFSVPPHPVARRLTFSDLVVINMASEVIDLTGEPEVIDLTGEPEVIDLTGEPEVIDLTGEPDEPMTGPSRNTRSKNGKRRVRWNRRTHSKSDEF